MNATTQAVYIWICSYADKYGRCYPSHQRLAKDTGTSNSTIERHLNKLVAAGLLQKEARMENGRQSSDQYQILLSTSLVKMTRGGRHNDEGGVVTSDEAELYPLELNPINSTDAQGAV